MSEVEYERLEGLLQAVTEKQRTVADNMLEAEKCFTVTEKAIMDLLNAVKKRRGNK